MNDYLHVCIYLSICDILPAISDDRLRETVADVIKMAANHVTQATSYDDAINRRWLAIAVGIYLTHTESTRGISQQLGLLRDVGQKLFDVPTNDNVRWVSQLSTIR